MASQILVKTEFMGVNLCPVNSIGNFGETFAKEKYIILDFQKNRVGIADMKW